MQRLASQCCCVYLEAHDHQHPHVQMAFYRILSYTDMFHQMKAHVSPFAWASFTRELYLQSPQLMLGSCHYGYGAQRT